LKKITIKYITDTISVKELEDLKELLKEKKNQITFEKYVRDYYDVNVLLNTPDVDLAYKKLWNSMEEQKPKQRVLPIWFRSAAAAAVFFVFLLSYLYVDNQQSTKVLNTFVKAVGPGVDKAILTFDDGSSVALGKGQVYKTDKVASNGEQIVYNNTESENIVYNYLTVPRGGQFEITLADGTQVWLNSESKLKYPVAFKEGVSRQVELVYGEAYFDVSPSEKHHGATFKVVSHLQEVEVLGTEFNIKAYQDDAHVYTTLVEGKVVVNNEVSKEKLSVNEQSVLSDVRGAIAISTVNVYNEIAWRKGVFSFKNKDLKEIMKALSRWYDVDIVFENKKLETIQFNGVLSKKMTLEEILNPIKRNINLNYKVYDNKIILK
jgi:ferric-dicitrate binding protein FerR (iron transport regulator)